MSKPAYLNKTDFDVAIDRLFNKVNEDYSRWRELSNMSDGGCEPKAQINLAIAGGRKYTKIVRIDNNGKAESVWGFIMAKDSDKFKAGDILKAASWRAPALNKARGNIYDDEYTVRWTGPLYL